MVAWFQREADFLFRKISKSMGAAWSGIFLHGLFGNQFRCMLRKLYVTLILMQAGIEAGQTQ
jgi:hypothetical protein